jgi:hypothetical protein
MGIIILMFKLPQQNLTAQLYEKAVKNFSI